MDKLYEYSNLRVNSLSSYYRRYIWEDIDRSNRLLFVLGARGVGKTTYLLQCIKNANKKEVDQYLYLSLDDLYFTKKRLVELADAFVKRGGKYLLLDEIHKYPNWSQEIKSVYDYFPSLKMIVTGSSALDIYKGLADLSRRAVTYSMQGLSFREFLALKYKKEFPVLSLEDILTNPQKHITPIVQQIKPIKLFEEYNRIGHYPYSLENEMSYHSKLKQVVNQVIENDLASIENIDYTSIHNLRKLLSILAEVVPYKPNISKLSSQVGVSRETLLKYMYWLAKGELLLLLKSGAKGGGKMVKPDKVYLNNPNLMYALMQHPLNIGTVRETFFFNQLRKGHSVTSTVKGDFLVDEKYTFEIGGKNKKKDQIEGVENAYIVADNIEFAHRNTIPLWLFGFLY